MGGSFTRPGSKNQEYRLNYEQWMALTSKKKQAQVARFKLSKTDKKAKFDEVKRNKMSFSEKEGLRDSIKRQAGCKACSSDEAQSCADAFRMQRDELSKTSSVRVKRESRKIIDDALKQQVSQVFDLCSQEKKGNCMSKVKDFVQESGGGKLNTAELYRLVKDGEGKRNEEKSEECNQGGIKSKQARKHCIQGMINEQRK